MPHFRFQVFRLDRDRIGEVLDVGGSRAGIGGDAGNLAHRLGAAARLAGGAADALRDRGHRGVLLIDGGRHHGGDRRHFTDDGVDLFDRARRVGGGRLDRADLLGDLLGRFRGLSGQRFHFRGDYRETLAGCPGAGRLDGGVEREQVGLPGDRLDQAHHLADAGGGVAEFRHRGDGALGFRYRAPRHVGGFRGLRGDLADRGRQFLDRTGSRRHIVGCGGDALLGGARIGRHGIGGLVEIARAHFELHGRPAQLAQRAFDRMLKLRDGERNRVVALRLRAARIGLDGGELFPLDHVVAEHDHRARHLANLIACVSGGNAGAGVAGGELLHHAGQAMKRLRDAASDQPAETKAERDHGDADHDYPGARMGLRCGQPR